MTLPCSRQSHLISSIHILSSAKQLSPFKSVLIFTNTMTDSDSRTALVWDLLVCSQLTEPTTLAGLLAGLLAGGGEAPVFNHSPHIHLAVPIIQGSVRERCAPCQPASPSCEKWVMEFKGTQRSLVAPHSHSGTAPAFCSSQHAAATAAVCGCVRAILVPAVKSTRLFGNVCQWIRRHSLSRSVGVSLSLSLSVCLLCKLAYILPQLLFRNRKHMIEVDLITRKSMIMKF